MLARMRYVTKRINASGQERWYWQRPGQPLTRLPDDPVKRFAEQAKLNASADKRTVTGGVEGSIRWLIAAYKDSDKYRDLSRGTKLYYARYLNDIEELGPGEPFAEIDRKMVVDFLGTYPQAHQRRKAAAVIKNLVGQARYLGLMETDPATDLRLKTTAPRNRIWSREEITSWLRHAEREDAHMVTAFKLLEYTAQRPGDMLAMTWAQYNGSLIRVRQQKTGALLDVPCDPALKAHLDGLVRRSLMIVCYRGRAVPYLRFNERFRRVCHRAGIDAQARDLRRTAMLAMALAGCTVPQIASVSGHSIDSTQRILETYLPRNVELAQAAITRLSEHRAGPKV